jgi:hypothetical protein
LKLPHQKYGESYRELLRCSANLHRKEVKADEKT